MKTILISSLAVVLLAGVAYAAEEMKGEPAEQKATPETPEKMPEMPAPTPEHKWLQKLAGEWEYTGEMQMGPGEPPQQCSGTETVRAIGDFWVQAESKGMFMDEPMTGLMTLGYDPEKGKFVGTWVGSMSNYLWNYEGTLDESGNVLTLKTEGPCPMTPDKHSKFKEKMEIKGPDERVFTSSMQQENGEWAPVGTMTYRRKQ